MACPDCMTGGLLSEEPTGIISTQGAYFTKPAGADSEPPKRAILLLTDAFGLPLKNPKIIADNLANRLKCDVWIPDYFAGRPLLDVDVIRLPERAGERPSVLDWIRVALALIPRIPAFISNRPSVVDVRVEKFINTLQEQKKYTKIGVIGYCYGGSTVVRLGSKDLVHSAVICHPGSFTMDQAKAIKVPTAWVCAEDDLFFSKSLRLNTEAMFAERKGRADFIDYEFRDYKGTQHGFAARPNLAIPEIKEAYEGQFEQIVEWFKKTLVV